MGNAMNSDNENKQSSADEKKSSVTSTSSTWTSGSSTETSTEGSVVASAGSVPEVGNIASANVEAAPKKKKTIAIVAAIAVVAVIAIIIGVVVAMGGPGFYDDSSKEGQAPYKTDEEIQAEMDRTVEDGMLNISIASMIEFQNGTSAGTAYIENVPSNKYVMKVTITLDDGGDVVYESGGIKPDNYIETITLTKDLDAGTYPATATFTAYEPDSLEEVGQAAAKITIVVNE